MDNAMNTKAQRLGSMPLFPFEGELTVKSLGPLLDANHAAVIAAFARSVGGEVIESS